MQLAFSVDDCVHEHERAVDGRDSAAFVQTFKENRAGHLGTQTNKSKHVIEPCDVTQIIDSPLTTRYN